MAEEETANLKDKLATATSILRWELCDFWGHVSARTPGGKSFLLRHLRPPPDSSVSSDEALEYDLDGNLLSGQRSRPDEIFFYICSYKAKTNIGAVVHCHPPMAISLVATGQRIIPIHQHSANFGRGVPVSPWLYGSLREDGEKAVKWMGKSCALVIRGHGALAVGETLEEACINMVRLERTAKMILSAASVGKPAPLPASAARKFFSVVERASKEPPEKRKRMSHFIEWQYYESLIKRGERWNIL